MKKPIKSLGAIAGILALVLLFFQFLYYTDNKYTIKPPFGQDGVLLLQEKDVKRGSPIYLIDGWEFYEGRVLPGEAASHSKKITYIGEYSNYSRGDPQRSPLGEATYRLVLAYRGHDVAVTVDFPELLSQYELWVDGERQSSGTGNAAATFLLKEGDTELLVTVKNDTGYYSGMFFPGAISQTETMMKARELRTLCYTGVFAATLALAFFSLRLWREKKAKVYRLFGTLCLAFCLYISYYFVHLFHLPFEKYWYLAEDASFYLLILVMLRLSVVSAKLDDRRPIRWLRVVALAFPALSVVLYLLIPLLPWAAALHSSLQNLYRVLVFLWLAGVAVYSAVTQVSEYHFLLWGNMVFGTGLLVNLLNTNRFEPAATFWQFEWCGIFLVLIFAGMMVKKSRRVLQENQQLTGHLEQLVESRTHNLEMVLEERRHFFSAMAHDLKAPLSATQTFIRMIQSHSVGVDQELSGYIAQVEEKQNEMKRRVDSLNVFTQVDKIVEPPQTIEVNEFVREIHQNFSPEAAVLGIYLKLELADAPQLILAQKEKLVIAMENLLCNAFSFTPMEGSVTLWVRPGEGTVDISVSDTGVGIEAEKLPRIFDRFYVGRQNANEGSGLGLYIVKVIAQELGGWVSVVSVPAKGSTFTITLPKTP